MIIIVTLILSLNLLSRVIKNFPGPDTLRLDLYKKIILISSMLYLVGLGLWDERDLSIKGLEACESADSVYAELYTSSWKGSLETLGKMIEREIKTLDRSGMEEGVQKIIEEAKTKTVVILVPGDPLVATTHQHILLDAKKNGVKTSVIHSSSIYTGIAATGLSLYSFGKTVSVVSPSENYNPSSYYERIMENKQSGLHTLLLLDIDMSIKFALANLFQIENEKGKGIITPLTEIVAASGLGSQEEKMSFGTAGDIIREEMPPPAVLIIPGELQFFEKEFLQSL
jgi:diphthine synthase